MATSYSTPGVYIQEVNAFPNSVVAVATAIPVFIGYTQMAKDQNGKDLTNIPTSLSSLSDYNMFFGAGPKSKFTVAVADASVAEEAPAADAPIPNPPPAKLTLKGKRLTISLKDAHRWYMYDSIRLFFANGGGPCYVVSVGNYQSVIGAKDLTAPLDIETGSLLKVMDPTLVVIPDAVALPVTDSDTGCYGIYQAVLMHCEAMQNRMGIFDLLRPDENANTVADGVALFRKSIGTSSLNYGASYYPWLKTGIARDISEIDFESLDIALTDSKGFTDVFPEADAKTVIEAYIDVVSKSSAAKTANDAALAADPQVPEDVAKTTKALNDLNMDNARRIAHLGLMATSPTYKTVINEITVILNEMPPSGAIAGIYTFVDNTRGVWKAPANVSINQVLAPSMDLNHHQTDNLNIDATSGKSINAIRSFPSIGTLVYGGRTLDGNSQDWRYINVRRTLIMMEQSIKLAARAYVFEPNDATTWVTVKSMLVNFLTNLWKAGALAGSAPTEAFDVQVGLGSTMTGNDILDGYMYITVLVAVVHPAEFIVITFQQKMQTS